MHFVTSTHNLIHKATHRRVLIGVVHATLGEDYRGNTGQSDEDSTVRHRPAYRRGGHKLG